MVSQAIQDENTPVEDGISLCLSGGGYRAMIFHLGALLRLNELGLLSRLSRDSSVSGGSITAAYLGLRWKDLNFDQDGRSTSLSIVVDNVRQMGRTTIDAGAIIGGILLPGSISDRVANAYDEVLFHGANLQDLPGDADGPRFVINATNVQTGALWRFSKPYMGDYRVGLVAEPDVKLSTAVAASSAFPPVLSPLTLQVGDDVRWQSGSDLALPEFRREVVLSDGGVYDNLGLETAFKRYRTLLVSDGGQKMAPEEAPSQDWGRHSLRILDLVDNQVRSLRKRQLIESYTRRDRTGCYWGIRSDFNDYKLDLDPLDCASRDPSQIAATPTRLQAMPDLLQEKLINWGYAITDAALRKHFKADIEKMHNIVVMPPSGFPYPLGY